MEMHGDLRTGLRQIHQLPVPTLGYLPLWLETLRRRLAADGVAALWCHASDDPAATAEATCWYAPQAPLSACERFAASDWAMPPVAELQRSLAHGELLCGHARRSRGGLAAAPWSLRRPPELAGCLADGDLLDVCLLPAPRACDEEAARSDGADLLPIAPPGVLRLFVSRRRSQPRFTAREVMAFETAAAEFATPPKRPGFPPMTAMTAMTSPAQSLRPEPSGAIGDDVAGTIVWHRRQPEWADPAALTLMRRVWQRMPGRAWPDACVVVQACQTLVDELRLHPSDASSPGVPVCTAVEVPGGTLHLHATHLCGMGGRATERVRIALHLAVPPAIRLLLRLWETGLTPVQREIAMRLLAGQSRAQTREACAIGVQTLKTHLSLMRARLDPVRDASLLLGLGGTATLGSGARALGGRGAPLVEATHSGKMAPRLE
ncbi:hypothetical protein OYT13_02250 [Pandoraea sp. XJJ-1]|uniref:helix-turn-helix transcriptional regulator n=1 Tax=Pandoraea sp. XJJ-1 TaxID=3002643 RepID=UPI002280D9A2|nr:hypothetical protein [Pandoraea sp. XJJ-1]WAL83324.1 hypothetical protein OYT13_02250 [Pandoraea sp. XJJ-1]